VCHPRVNRYLTAYKTLIAQSCPVPGPVFAKESISHCTGLFGRKYTLLITALYYPDSDVYALRHGFNPNAVPRCMHNNPHLQRNHFRTVMEYRIQTLPYFCVQHTLSLGDGSS
jgi:hypothetical protein